MTTTTSPEMISAIRDAINQIEDPRIDRRKLHPLENVLFIAFCTLLCDGEGWADMQQWGELNADWLSTFLEMPYGVPSADTFARLFARIDNQAFERLFHHQMRGPLAQALQQKQVIALDGKTLRNSAPAAGSSEITRDRHVVSAYATAAELVVAQQTCEAKSNEITAVTDLLDQFNLEGQIISTDALLTQKSIAEYIHHRGGEYILALKKNQKTLYEQVEALLDAQPVSYERTEKDHGRIETRRLKVLTRLDLAEQTEQWAGLQSVVWLHTRRDVKGQVQESTRLFISSLQASEAQFAQWIRSHWQIENQLHWVLDVVFREDHACIDKGFAPLNLSLLRKMCLKVLKADNDKASIRRKRKKAAWNRDYLIKLLNQLFAN